MADFNKPVTGDTYVDHFQDIREKDTSLAKLFDGTSDTNLPDGTIRINSGQGYRLEKWDSANSTWNAITTGLGDLDGGLTNLTSGEVSQLQNINSVTISNTQWGYVGGMDQALSSADSPDFGNATISSTQWGYVGGLDQALSTSDNVDFNAISQSGNSVLDTSNLAANNGSVPEVDRTNTFTEFQDFGGISGLGIGNVTNANTAPDSGTNDGMWLRSGPNRQIVADIESNAIGDAFRVRYDSALSGGQADTEALIVRPDGVAVGDGTTTQGAGTLNAELYDNGNRVARKATGSSSASSVFGNWYTADANRGSFLFVDARISTTTNDSARIDIDISDTGNTSNFNTSNSGDYSHTVIAEGSSGFNPRGHGTFYVPAGGTYKLKSVSDPNGNNLVSVRQITI